jgi:thioredoxin-dependent peroxiredoxin
MTEWIEQGEPAPDFELQTDRGEPLRLSAQRGKPVVLYFYPKDDTPGCTVEACAFRDRRPELAERGALVLGVSPDGVASHAKFRDKFSLDFPLLADPDHKVAEAYGAWRERTNYGKTFMGIQRKVWKKVDVKEHDQQVIDALASLS